MTEFRAQTTGVGNFEPAPRACLRNYRSALSGERLNGVNMLRREGIRNTQGWLPRMNKDGTFRDNYITDLLRRVLKQPPKETLAIANAIWEFLTSNDLLISHRAQWKLDHQRILVSKATARYRCTRCGVVSTFSPASCCPKKGCPGPLAPTAYDLKSENLISKWVAGDPEVRFSSLRSEEHTAQINKDLAKAIEDDFRSSGVNLLSSTTTFEMGINIGDLQKVLLRNAPPSSASYIQRIGRAGRGRDKNAICVTMCRRTKYDSDAWANPPLLMSGEVRTPAVFIKNRIIAQRHFNAVAFAQFLRIKVAQEKKLGETVKQKVRLESFLPMESRKNIPDAWMQVRHDTHLDFHSWLSAQAQAALFTGPAGAGIVTAVGGFANGKDSGLSNYRETIARLADELATLFTERQRLVAAGSFTSDVERSIKELLASNVIDVLAREGFLPRYAFPLDVVTLETHSS